MEDTWGDFQLNATMNLTNDSSMEYESFNRELVENIVKIVVPLFFGVIYLLGLIGNLLVIIIVIANPGMRSTTNILIINLAVADLLFVIFCIPFTAVDYVLPYWPFGVVWCKIVQYLIIVTAYASVYTLVLMSFDRYLAVVHPISSMLWRTEHHAIIAICLAWIIISGISTPALIIHGEAIALPENYTACQTLGQYDWPFFQASFFFTSYVIPLALISIFYVCMLVRLWRGARVSAESRRGRKRVTRLVLIVVSVFAICWCPIQIILVIKSWGLYPITEFSIMIQITSHILAYMNSCVNPILYAFLSDNFRKAFRKIIYCRPPPDSNTRQGPMTKTTRAPSTTDII